VVINPPERLAAQQRDHEKLQRERQLRSWQRKQEAKALGEAVMKRPVGRPCMQLQQAAFSHLRLPLCVAIAACKPLTSLSLLLSTVQHQHQPQHQPQLQPLTNSSSSAQAASTGGLSNLKINSTGLS